jgi:hypothetical protein
VQNQNLKRQPHLDHICIACKGVGVIWIVFEHKIIVLLSSSEVACASPDASTGKEYLHVVGIVPEHPVQISQCAIPVLQIGACTCAKKQQIQVRWVLFHEKVKALPRLLVSGPYEWREVKRRVG